MFIVHMGPSCTWVSQSRTSTSHQHIAPDGTHGHVQGARRCTLLQHSRRWSVECGTVACDSGVSGNVAAQLTQLQHCRRCRGQSRIVGDSAMRATGDVSSETNPDICQVRSVPERCKHIVDRAIQRKIKLYDVGRHSWKDLHPAKSDPK